MSVESRLRELAERVQGMSGGFSERDTERYLVEPFMDALGYDSRNPAEVQAQLPVKIGSTTKNCDYAVSLHGEVRVLVECKKVGVSLDNPGQLASYFSQVPTALLGIYTNGFEYRFYAERNLGRVKQMDEDPFLTLNLRNLDQTAIGRAAKCGREQLGDADGFQLWVTELRHTRVVGDRLRRELTGQPSDELVNLAMDWAGVTEKTPELVERFRGMLKEAARSILVPARAEREVKAGTNAQHSTIRSTSREGWLALGELIHRLESQGTTGHGDMRRNAPRAIRFPDGREVSLGSWLQMAMETAYWLYSKGLLGVGNCEIQDAVFPTRRILSGKGLHPRGNPFRWGGKPVRDTGIKIDTQRSGLHFAQNVHMLCERFGEDPSQVYLKLS